MPIGLGHTYKNLEKHTLGSNTRSKRVHLLILLLPLNDKYIFHIGIGRFVSNVELIMVKFT